MPLRTKRWDDDVEPDDGFRLLITRYRPRGLPKWAENWRDWWPELAPSKELHAGAYGKGGLKISWPIYVRKFYAEMKSPAAQARLAELRERLAQGETITLLCSSACVRESRCHRSLLRAMLEGEMQLPIDN